MHVVITTGHPHSDYRWVHSALEMAGVLTAQPSRYERLTPEALTERILRTDETDPNAAASPCQMNPSKVSHDLAADLFLENTSQENWGWADGGTTRLLNFWLGFSEQTRFVLTYSSPGFSIANMAVRTDSLASAVTSWTQWNAKLLRFAARHTDRCILVNTAAVRRSPAALVKCASEYLNLHLQESSGNPSAGAAGTYTLASLLTDRLLEDYPDALALYDELESAAHLGDECTNAGSVTAIQAWNEYLASTSELAGLRTNVGELAERCRSVECDLRSTETSRDDAGKHVEELRGRLGESLQSIAIVDEQKHQFEHRTSELTEENQLLFLQLTQLQDALEHTTSAHNKSEQRRLELEAKPIVVAPAAVFRRTKGHLAEVAVDMRQEIDGKNWYWAEHDGRWAGPETFGTLRLPAMGPGRYEINLEVVDAMDPEILTSMEVMLCGTPILLERKGKAFPAILKGVASVDEIGAEGDWDLSFRFPSLRSPAQRGSSDSRQLAIRLRSLRLRALQTDNDRPNLPN